MRGGTGATILVTITVAMTIWIGCQSEKSDTGGGDFLVLQFDNGQHQMRRERVLLVTCTEEARLVADGNQVSLPELTASISSRLATTPDLLVLLDAAAPVSCQVIEEVLVAVREGGVYSLIFARDFAKDQSSIPYMLPPPELESLDIKAKNRLEVGLHADGRITLKGDAGDQQDVGASGDTGGERTLAQQVTARLEANPNLVIFVEPEMTVSYGALFTTLQELRAAGARRISLWGRLGAG